MSLVSDFRVHLRGLIRQLGVLQARYPELGLGVSQCHALLELQQQPRSVGELSEILHIDASSASRNLKTLERHGLAASQPSSNDGRIRNYRMTAKGKRKVAQINERGDRVISDAAEFLTPQERQAVWQGVAALEKAVARSQAPGHVAFRLSRPADNAAIATVIRTVLEELDMAVAGTAYFEPQTDQIHETFAQVNGRYMVLEQAGDVCGGGGIYPHNQAYGELKNMYFMAEIRGRGYARKLMNLLLDFARDAGFSIVFLETNANWKTAIRLYESFGFQPSQPPDFYAGHCACDRFFALNLPQ